MIDKWGTNLKGWVKVIFKFARSTLKCRKNNKEQVKENSRLLQANWIFRRE